MPFAMRVVISSAVWAVLACDSSGTKPADPKSDAKAKPSPLEPRGLEEMKTIKGDVEKAHEDGLKRNDDAIERAAQGEAVERGTPSR